MKTDKLFKSFLVLIVINLLNSCISNKEDNYILYEEFETNEIGWIEEQTDFHFLEIKNGEYYIHSKDTSSARSSSGSKADWYLYGLPKQYEIKTSIKTSDISKEKTHFGLILYSPTIEYLFIIYTNGDLIVSEYDYNSEKYKNLLAKNLEISLSDPIELSIIINDMEFIMKINDKKIGNGTFKTKTSSWNDLRLFTSSESAILVDYLKIKRQ
ncbi:MAG: hypothetical protein Q8R57_05685 [Bacteroidota bacterium]|nr:hypothetical protein [Bacteroidota bacterium]